MPRQDAQTDPRHIPNAHGVVVSNDNMSRAHAGQHVRNQLGHGVPALGSGMSHIYDCCCVMLVYAFDDSVWHITPSCSLHLRYLGQ